MNAPNEYQLSVISQAAFLRGSIITSYAQVEHLLADIFLRCQPMPDYNSLPAKFPFKLATRIKLVRQMVGMPGPLAIYGERFESVISRLLEFEEIRHFMAHGLLHVKTRKDEWHELVYRMYRQKDNIEEGQMVTDLTQLDFAAREVGKYSTQAVSLFRDVYLEHKIEAR